MALSNMTNTQTPGPARDFIGYGRTPPFVVWPDGAKVAINLVLVYEEGSEYSWLEDNGRNDNWGEYHLTSRPLVPEREHAGADPRGRRLPLLLGSLQRRHPVLHRPCERQAAGRALLEDPQRQPLPDRTRLQQSARFRGGLLLGDRLRDRRSRRGGRQDADHCGACALERPAQSRRGTARCAGTREAVEGRRRVHPARRHRPALAPAF